MCMHSGSSKQLQGCKTRSYVDIKVVKQASGSYENIKEEAEEETSCFNKSVTNTLAGWGLSSVIIPQLTFFFFQNSFKHHTIMHDRKTQVSQLENIIGSAVS